MGSTILVKLSRRRMSNWHSPGFTSKSTYYDTPHQSRHYLVGSILLHVPHRLLHRAKIIPKRSGVQHAVFPSRIPSMRADLLPLRTHLTVMTCHHPIFFHPRIATCDTRLLFTKMVLNEKCH
jgi:hypothetical protein